MKPKKMRIAHTWTNRAYGLNCVLAKPDVSVGAINGFLLLSVPGGPVAGIDPQGGFLHFLVAPAPRRFLWVRHPASSRLRVDLFLPSGLGPSPGLNDRCVKEVLASLRIINSADALRMVGLCGH